MFYPVDSLKRGGRFYLCWVADSWPLRFATITHRQLWSQDIRKICDELIEVIANESGRPSNRYSLRLSSQLMRGLVRLYQRKVSIFLSDLCMINANVIKHANKKFNVYEVLDLPHREPPRRRLLELPTLTIQEPENEPRVEELIQNSNNVVANIQDITLKEATIPEFQLPPNDGFGEENPDVALQSAVDRTIEQIMLADVSVAQQSGLGLAFDVTDKSRDKSRLGADLQMERLSEHDVTMFRRSDGEGLLPVADFEKDIPEIPDVPIPELSVLQEKQQEPPAEIPEAPIEQIEAPLVTNVQDFLPIELEELEEPAPKRPRLRRRLIIDKKTKIDGDLLRARIADCKVEQRCKKGIDDKIDLRVPFEVLLRRPSRAGHSIQTRFGQQLNRMFKRNLGVINKPTRIDRDEEAAMIPRGLDSGTLARIEEPPVELEAPLEIERAELVSIQEPPTNTRDKKSGDETSRDKKSGDETSREKKSGDETSGDKTRGDETGGDKKSGDETREEQDISDMPTQKLQTLSQAKRRSAARKEPTAKKRRTLDNVPVIVSRTPYLEDECAIPMISVTDTEQAVPHPIADKENVPANMQIRMGEQVCRKSGRIAPNEADNVTALLQEAGLADIPPEREMRGEVRGEGEGQGERRGEVRGEGRRERSDSSEIQLGSLDRTKVSLGDSDQTTDSKRFIRDQWGTEGTMTKILTLIKGRSQAVTVQELLARGPIISKYKRLIAARCFSSILKLKQHQFIIVKKHPETLEIVDIAPGPKLY